jgi:DNA-binding response OmpR family regulator
MYVIEKQKVFNAKVSCVQSGSRSPQICIITESETNVEKLVMDLVRHEGFAVRVCLMGHDTIQQMEPLRPTLVMIQTTVAWGTVVGLCQGFRRAGIPVIVLSANASEEERILGLEAGADDYITVSSSRREIVARLRATIRRVTRREGNDWTHVPPPLFDATLVTHNPTMKVGDIEIDPRAMRVLIRGIEIETTNLEFRLLYYLIKNLTRVFTRDQLLEAIWGPQNNVELRSVDACVRRLRYKIEPDPLHPTYVRTVRGAGYCLKPAAE